MTLQELQQIKDSLSQGVMIHKGKWLEVLEWAIELTKHHDGVEDEKGWSFWTGGDVPVEKTVFVRFLCRAGYGGESLAGNLDWSITNCGDDIIKYKVAP